MRSWLASKKSPLFLTSVPRTPNQSVKCQAGPQMGSLFSAIGPNALHGSFTWTSDRVRTTVTGSSSVASRGWLGEGTLTAKGPTKMCGRRDRPPWDVCAAVCCAGWKTYILVKTLHFLLKWEASGISMLYINKAD